MSWLKLGLINNMHIPTCIECPRFYICFRSTCTLLLFLVFDDLSNLVLVEHTLGISNSNFTSMTVGTLNKLGCYREANYVILISHSVLC